MPIKVREAARDMVVIVDECRDLGEDAMPAAMRFIEGLADEAERDRLRALDEAWDSINAIGGSHREGDLYGEGMSAAIDKALRVIADMGGMNPARRVFRCPPSPPATASAWTGRRR